MNKVVRNIEAVKGLLRDASDNYGVSRTRIMPRFLDLYGRKAFSVNEIRALGLLNPQLSTGDLNEFTSKQEFLELLERINPQTYSILTEDKRIFSAMCRAYGLPVPSEIGYVERGVASFPGGEQQSTHAGIAATLHARLPDKFVVKSAGGVYGRDIQVLERMGDSIHGADGKVLSWMGFAKELDERSHEDCQLLQAHLKNHESLRAFGGDAALCCTRFNTFMDDQCQPRLLFYMHKMASGTSSTDNFAFGRYGNLIAKGDESGRLTSAVAASDSGMGLTEIDEHPTSGQLIGGAELPFWHEARELVLQAAPIFWPLRTLGWDVALTDDGPVLIEANTWWDPVNYGPELISSEDMACLKSAGAKGRAQIS